MAGKLLLITGTDRTAIAQQAAEAVSAVAGPHPDDFSLEVIRDGDEVTTADAIGQVVQAVRTPSFLGGVKTVWLKNFSGFDEEKATGGPVAKAFQMLYEFLAAGLPPDVNLVLSGSGIDRRRKLFKLCSEHGETVILIKPELTDRDWQAKMSGLITERAGAKGLHLAPDALDHLVGVIGTETAAVECELDKLVCYMGESTEEVPYKVAHLLCRRDADTVPWGMNDAVIQRNLGEALRQLSLILAAEKDPESAILGLSRQLASTFLQMIQLQVLMSRRRLRPGQINGLLKDMDSDTKEQLASEGLEVVFLHPFRAMRLAEQAVRFSENELIDAITALRDVYRFCVTSSGSNQIMLESTLVKICGGKGKDQRKA